jgi:N-acyl-D-aspartate/D-glutamate deacylase
MVADLNVIDYARFGPELPQLVHDLPSGARRLVQRSSGIKATLVAGETLFMDGKHTGALPGRLLKSQAAALAAAA